MKEDNALVGTGGAALTLANYPLPLSTILQLSDCSIS